MYSCSPSGEKWLFDFKCWLDSKRGLSAKRAPSKYKGPGGLPPGTLCNYRVELTTGPNEESKMEKGQVFVNLMGDKGESGEPGRREGGRGGKGGKGGER